MATPYQRTSPLGAPGTAYEFNSGDITKSAFAVAPIAFGEAVCLDANGGATPLDPSSNLTFAGPALSSRVGNTAGDSYAIGDLVPYGVRYSAIVTLTGATASTVGGTVYRVPATGAFTAVSTGNIEVENASFAHVGSAGDAVGVRFEPVT